MTGLDGMLKEFPLPTWRPLAWTVIAAVLGVASWASVAEVDRLAIAQGVVAPQGQVRTIQHLEGGIAEKIHVREGDRVRAGQPLAQIDLGGGGLNGAEILVRLDALKLERARVLAEASQIDLALPEEETARQPALAEAEKAAYRTRKREYESGLAVLRDQRSQKELEIESIAKRLAAAKKRLDPLLEQREIAAKLIDQDLMPKTAALRIETDVKEIEAEVAGLEAALPQAQTALAEARERELFERNRFRKQAAERLREIELEIARQEELYGRAATQKERTVIASPIDGVVKNLRVNTIGGVIRAGEPIVEIVPSQEKLVIEARLSPNDIGHVRVDQPAQIKISTYNYLSYGTLEGRISHIAADANVDENGAHYFRLIVETDRDFLEVDGDRYPISPGMSAEVDVKLGRRNVLRYLVEPVLKLRSEAFTSG